MHGCFQYKLPLHLNQHWLLQQKKGAFLPHQNFWKVAWEANNFVCLALDVWFVLSIYSEVRIIQTYICSLYASIPSRTRHVICYNQNLLITFRLKSTLYISHNYLPWLLINFKSVMFATNNTFFADNFEYHGQLIW